MIFDRLRRILLEEPTGSLRFFFGLGALGYGIVMPNFVGYPMYELAYAWMPASAWSAAFVINGLAMIFGSIANKPSFLMYLLEAVLGVAVWLSLGLATTFAQGMPGPTFFASFIAVWIFVRYPEWK